MNRVVPMVQSPLRIVSLVPSITELLYDLGLEERVVGITKFCVHPDYWRKCKKVVGGTKTLKLDVLLKLEPDWVIGAKEENDRMQMETLMGRVPVFMSDVSTVDDAIDLIRSIGAICGVKEKAKELADSVEQHLHNISLKASGRVAYLIWDNPLMCAGEGTYIHSILSWMGYTNVVAGVCHGRYPELTLEELKSLKPEMIFLSSEPYPFGDKHLELFGRYFSDSNVICVDGEMLSWYGSRMLKIRIPNQHAAL